MLVLLAALAAGVAHAAGPAPFDLSGPTLDVVVTRNKMILPASEVPNLMEGDKLWIKTEFPRSQAADYLMVAVFLRGSTNPPPEDWFFPCKTWTGKCARDGLSLTVPKGAQQMVVLLAPSTAGDMHAVLSAIRGRPGAFVRATQDLNQASLDRSRLERYLASIHVLQQGDPAELKEVAPLLARSLAIKVDEKCLDKIPQLQAACLTQGQEALILNDGQSNSIAQTLANGPGSDLVMAAAATPELGYGIYSPYIASILDLVRIFDSFSTAQFQYIPALVSHKGDKLALTLNAVPSFYDPKSVLVVAMPAIDKAQLPPLRPVDPKEIYCASSKTLVLAVEGAPLAFSTGYAHDITLALTLKNGQVLRLPARPDAAQGGYVVSTEAIPTSALGDKIRGSLQGYWGFEKYEGPSFELRNAHADSWALADGDENDLVIGRQDVVHLRSTDVACVDNIMFRDPAGKELKVKWKAVKPDEVEVSLPLENAQPGAMSLLVAQSGGAAPQAIPINVFANSGRLDSFTIHAGDAQGVLKGGRLDNVVRLTIGSTAFSPGTLSTERGTDVLPMTADDPQAAANLKAQKGLVAKVTLKDGREARVPVTVGDPRPRVALIGMSVQPSASSNASNIRLAGKDELPHDATLTFSLRAQQPAAFARTHTIEVATADGAFSTALGIDNGGLRLENASVALAVLDPGRAFGFSAFGPLKFRSVVDSVPGDWQPLATLVRLPQLKGLQCPEDPQRACKLTGTDLFLIDSVSGSANFAQPVKVSDGFPGYTLPVPHPTNGLLYLRLRDEPSVINSVALQVQPLPPSPDEVSQAAPAAPVAAANPAPSLATEP